MPPLPTLSIRRSTYINDPGSTGPPLSDAHIAARISDLYARAPELRGVEVGVQDGYVTLSGSLTLLRDKVRAELLASQVRGVVDVDNQLAVHPLAAPPAPPPHS